MTQEQIDHISCAVMRIRSLENSPNPDWNLVEKISDETLKYINELSIFVKIDSYVYKFLEDFDIRKKDAIYGAYQRSKIVEYLIK